MSAIIEAARRAAWWPFGNLSSPDLYAARRSDHDMLRDALARHPGARPRSPEAAAVLECARRLAVHSGSNRYGFAYHDRKAAQLALRGALDAMDRQAAA